jgi:hypothetical protein
MPPHQVPQREVLPHSRTTYSPYVIASRNYSKASRHEMVLPGRRFKTNRRCGATKPGAALAGLISLRPANDHRHSGAQLPPTTNERRQ